MRSVLEIDYQHMENMTNKICNNTEHCAWDGAMSLTLAMRITVLLQIGEHMFQVITDIYFKGLL